MDGRCRRGEYIKGNSWAGRRFDHEMNVWGREIIHVPGVLMKGYMSVGVCACRSAGEVQIYIFLNYFLYLAVPCHQK